MIKVTKKENLNIFFNNSLIVNAPLLTIKVKWLFYECEQSKLQNILDYNTNVVGWSISFQLVLVK